MESQPQNPEFNPENFHPCNVWLKKSYINKLMTFWYLLQGDKFCHS